MIAAKKLNDFKYNSITIKIATDIVKESCNIGITKVLDMTLSKFTSDKIR